MTWGTSVDPMSMKSEFSDSPASLQDTHLLKALAIVLADVLPVSRRCTHVKGDGGAKAAVRCRR